MVVISEVGNRKSARNLPSHHNPERSMCYINMVPSHESRASTAMLPMIFVHRRQLSLLFRVISRHGTLISATEGQWSV
jgi:hypothetical protein